MFEIVYDDGQTDDGQTDGRRLDGYTISSPCEPNGSGELKKRSSGFPTRSHTNRAVQPQKMARGLKFQI